MSDDSPPHKGIETLHVVPKKGWGSAQWLRVGLLAFGVLLIVLSANSGSGVYEKARHMQALNNCRQIIIALRSYAIDHDGKYPCGVTSNDAFRELIIHGYLDDERIFTSPASPFISDNDSGNAPDFSLALEAGENHWAMTKGLDLKSDGATPLVFENPITPTWPPRWDSIHANRAFDGRMWTGWVIIVGRNDGSVALEKLIYNSLPTTTLRPVKDGKNLFELAGPHEILDVER